MVKKDGMILENLIIRTNINTMNIVKTEIDGVLIIEPRLFRDARGYFFESFSEREFEEKAYFLMNSLKYYQLFWLFHRKSVFLRQKVLNIEGIDYEKYE